MLLQIAGADKEREEGGWHGSCNLCSRCMIKIEKVKQRVSAVAYVTLRGEVMWVHTNRTRAF